ncbi:MAG: leucyl aminopeptidase, partial [Planctomycetes bacterium]|nr:leucyl aminopeptidase [Planctomycetota bacterium]
MRITAADSNKALTATPLLAVLAAAGESPALPRGVKIPAAAKKDFSGKARGDRLADASSGPAERVLLLGLGREPGAEELRRAAARAVKAAKKVGLSALRIHLAPGTAKSCGGAAAAGQALAEGAGMGAYVYTGGKSKPKQSKLKRCVIAGSGVKFRAGVKDGAALAEANLFTRDLQNLAGNQMTPRNLAAAARKLSTRSPRISCRVMDEAAMKKMKMGLLLGVSRGSVEPARLIHLVYRPKGKAKRKVALVGKGLTFDAGGISLKPSAKMDEMRYDMSGSAAVLGAFHALA